MSDHLIEGVCRGSFEAWIGWYARLIEHSAIADVLRRLLRAALIYWRGVSASVSPPRKCGPWAETERKSSKSSRTRPE
jgi:hypothetical protein